MALPPALFGNYTAQELSKVLSANVCDEMAANYATYIESLNYFGTVLILSQLTMLVLFVIILMAINKKRKAEE